MKNFTKLSKTTTKSKIKGLQFIPNKSGEYELGKGDDTRRSTVEISGEEKRNDEEEKFWSG